MKKAKENIIILGGGGHAKVLIDLIKTANLYKISGILDSNLEKGNKVFGVPILGADELLLKLYNKGHRMIGIGVGSIKSNDTRMKLYDNVQSVGFSTPFLIHSTAYISKNALVNKGVQVMAGAIIQPGASVGENTIINTGTVVEHDCKIGKHTHICPGVVISGSCIIGDNSFIGAGATIIQGINIGKNVVIGAGSVVIKDVSDYQTVKGNPVK